AELKGGGYVLSRGEDILAAFTVPVLGNAPSRFSMLAAKHRGQYVAAQVAGNIPPFLDKPRHIDMRRPLSAAFHDVFDGAQGWIEALAHDHVARLVGTGDVDIVADLGRPFATQAMARFVGLEHDPQAIATATGALFKLFAPIADRAGFAQVNAGLEAARGFIAQAVAARRAAPGDDLISRLIAYGAANGSPANEAEIADNALLVLADGIENIEAAIAQVLIVLAGVPDQRAALFSGQLDPGKGVLETHRLQTPAQLLPRVVREAHERHGVRLAEGTPVFLALGSANRDPALHPDPDRFDPDRDLSQVLVFGRGRHSCIGRGLGEHLVTAATAALAQREVELIEDPARITYVARLGHRWPTALRARIT
ncbi:MAG TPA: cytochrome P450, partial [Rhodobacterales bacterium]|nr:cytochrome P450 [Rhodobacterales bacterium]